VKNSGAKAGDAAASCSNFFGGKIDSIWTKFGQIQAKSKS